MAGKAPPPGGQKIITAIIEDQIPMRKAMLRVLESEGIYEVHEFSNSKEAIEFLRSRWVDMVVSDIFLQKGSGFEILRFMRGRTIASDIPVVFVTGEATKDDIVYAIDMGASDYILKPFEPHELTAKLRTVLERYRNPSERIQRLRQAEAHFLNSEFEASIEIFRALYLQDEKSVRVMVGLAQALAAVNKMDEAVRFLKLAEAENPNYFPSFAVRSNLLLKQGNKTEALEYLEKEIRIHGRQAHRRALLADLYFEQGNFQSGLDHMRQALVDDPKDESSLLKMAELLLQAGEPEKALHYYQKTRRKVPNSTRALEGIAHVCTMMKNPKRALGLFADFLSLNPHQKDVLLARARLYDKIGEGEKALGDLSAYLLTDGESVEALQLEARILGKLERHVEAADVWKEVARIVPTADNFARVGLSSLKTNNYEEAARYYADAVSMDPYNVKFLFNLAFSYESLKNIPKASEFYGRVTSLVPNNAEALEAMRRLQALQRSAAQISRVPKNRAS